MSTIAVNAITDANGGATTTINSVTPNANNVVGKNRIINGNMAIDQRNAGAAVTVTNAATTFFSADRFFANRTNGYALSTSTIQQVSDAPAGFVNSIKYTNSTAETPTGSFYSNLQQYIEGFNVADLSWGASGAKSVTLSFWVKISITGTFGGTLRAATADASFPFSFSYGSANTWQFVSITIPGPTIGTFYTTNVVGFSVNWDLGVGPNLSASATGAWQAVNAIGLTGGVKLNSTAGATYQITGVQLEVGSVATEFEHRPYTTELQLCHRYFEKFAPGIADGATIYVGSYAQSPGGSAGTWYFKQEMRAIPTISLGSGSSAANTISRSHVGVFAGVNTYGRILTPTTASAEL